MQKLRSVFGLESFRTNQLEAITALLSGQDSMVLMPTGGGKSLCYQLPAVCEGGKTRGTIIVIGPLLALMQDQVAALQDKGVDVAFFNSEQTHEEVKDVCRRLVHPIKRQRPNLLYVTPEKLKHSSALMSILRQLYTEKHLKGYVLDEGHCAVKWGRDFRDAYRFLNCLRQDFPGIPIMALTATATAHVKHDLKHLLRIPHCVEFSQSMNRPNLNYEVRPKKKMVLQEIAQFIKESHARETGIIYAHSRKSCEEIAYKLREEHGLDARHFHAKVDSRDKAETLDSWKTDACQIIVATIAFGMGIDKSDVRFVIHHDLPGDLDGYYQETGRAGRDGQPADCILFYQYRDATIRQQQIRDNKDINETERAHQTDELRRVVQFCQNNVDCRRMQVLAYYGENFDIAICRNGCDNCRNPLDTEVEDVTETAVQIIQLAQSLITESGEWVTRNHLVDIIKGSAAQQIKAKGWNSQSLYGLGKDMSKERIERLVDRLETEGVFCQTTARNGGDWSQSYMQASI
ncbi:ATP-dependent DNA helicase [Laetiporus sulphureus 93-53]|uniref:ATP-dependent DNA helicase n=1 Tax=Laetiporus sulphureus 93-53 TaxID=1314785 RepID=A0A165CWF0_9APHY|nr:ATP-dependent DNA helicase [Laetiporus sulphureus 93-53]KZT03577.1 ATP-dependent DNA helicase [Laetiporus sulphureus 93-53]